MATGSFLGLPDGMIDPSDPIGSMVDAIDRELHSFSAAGGSQVAATYAYQLTKSPAVAEFVGENLGKLVPIVGYGALAIQGGRAIREGVNQFKECN